jgi:gamma-glutamyl hydrolase
VPLRFTAPPAELQALFTQVNGLLLPGGLTSITNSTFASAAQLLVALALDANAHGDTFPVWGTCLGFEQLMVYTSGHPNSTVGVLSPVEAEDVFLDLDFFPGALSASLLAAAPPDVVAVLRKGNVTINMHQWGVLNATFFSNAALSAQWTPLATSTDPAGNCFISLVEHRAFPIFGSQFHPEKNVYEWAQGHPDFVHSAAAVRASQYLAQQFVDATRASSHAFASPEAEQAALIYNWNPTFTGVNGHVEQTYFF